MTDQPTTVEAWAARNLERQIRDTAARVDDMAGTLRRYADDVARVDGTPGRRDYATVVARVVNEVATTLMNLSLGSLSTAAVTADTARVKGE